MLKHSHKHQLLYARGGDDDAWPKCHEEARCYCSASCCTVPSPGTSRSQSLALRPVAKHQSSQHIPVYWGQRHPGSLLSHFMFLNNSNTDTHHLKIILATWADKVRTKNKEKKIIPSLYTKSIQWQPSTTLFKPLKWFTWSNFSKVFKRFLVQSQNIIFYFGKEKRLLKVKCTRLESLHSSTACLCPTSLTRPALSSAAGPQTDRWTNVLGQATTKITKALFQCCKMLWQLLSVAFSKR